MSDRLTDYLERCLSEVPDSKYRLRLHQELEEHLADLTESFLARGFEEGVEAALAHFKSMVGEQGHLLDDLIPVFVSPAQQLQQDKLMASLG